VEQFLYLPLSFVSQEISQLPFAPCQDTLQWPSQRIVLMIDTASIEMHQIAVVFSHGTGLPAVLPAAELQDTKNKQGACIEQRDIHT
jgi:hypothetical protein